MEKLGLIDVSLEDDFLVSPGNEGFVDPTATIEQPECSQQLGSATKEEEARKKVTSLNEEIPELCQSPQRKSSKSGINLRKSLAWDSAFFTCEGVLNTEELATINTTYSQNEKPSLAGIPEEVRTSGESTTTLDTDNWTLESLESELFDNVRASIQKSLGFSEKDPSPTSGSSEKNRKEGSNPSRLGSKEKVARASQNKMKVPTGEKKTACLPPKQPQNSWKRASLDSKIMAVDGGGVQSKTASANAPRMLPKPTLPRTLTKTTAPPVSIQKRSSTGSALTRKPVSQPSQAPSISISRSMTGPPRCAPSASSGTSKKTPSVAVSKSSQAPSISVSRSMMGPPRCAPSASSGTSKKTPSVASPNPKTKSPICTTNKRVAATRTPTQASPKSKIGKSKPNPLQLPSISPRSSIDSIRSTNTTDSVDRGSPVSLSGLNLAKDLAHGSLSRSSSSSSIASQERSFKPSGLRMPSIKLGYFDGGKPLVNAPSLQKNGFFASPQINGTNANTEKPASSTVIEDPGVTSQRKNCVEKENMTPMNPSESSKIEVNLLEEKISSLSLSQV
ncbi:hypothetical protein FCM35_KLT19601 [Carex littledalei]|uniref:Uncharacterized protein n=1 Tax=Carex littledalei TaxID=544730 RepID=A0A833R1X6_9POAL|nr:hypothetical protein FCM35_KLT19601 [Carex littledalei]